MRVVVGYQWAAPPKEATVLKDGTVTWAGARRAVGAADRVAIELARQLADSAGVRPVAESVGVRPVTDSAGVRLVADSAGVRLVGVTVCEEQAADPRAQSTALACGLDEAILVQCEREPDTGDVAAALAAVVRDMDDVRVVVIGSCSTDSGTRMVGPTLGGLLGWPVLTDVRDVTVDEAGVLRVVDESRETLRRSLVEGPVVLSATVDARTPRQLGLREILAAGSKPSRIMSGADLGVQTGSPLEALGRGPMDLGHRLGNVITERNPAIAAAQLVESLMESGVL
jgi:electron transfer flavoprotein beta subunit